MNRTTTNSTTIPERQIVSYNLHLDSVRCKTTVCKRDNRAVSRGLAESSSQTVYITFNPRARCSRNYDLACYPIFGPHATRSCGEYFFYLQIFLWMEKKKPPLVSKYIAVGQIHVMGLVAALQLLQHYTFLVIAHSPANIWQIHFLCPFNQQLQGSF